MCILLSMWVPLFSGTTLLTSCLQGPGPFSEGFFFVALQPQLAVVPDRPYPVVAGASLWVFFGYSTPLQFYPSLCPLSLLGWVLFLVFWDTSLVLLLGVVLLFSKQKGFCLCLPPRHSPLQPICPAWVSDVSLLLW